MFTSRAEHRLVLRADNAPESLIPLARDLSLIGDEHWSIHQARRTAIAALESYLKTHSFEGVKLYDYLKRPEVDEHVLLNHLPADDLPPMARDRRLVAALISEVKYAPFVERHAAERDRLARIES